jgi:ketosteroid isomerase-like protein
MKPPRLFLAFAVSLLCAAATRADEASDKAELIKMEKDFAALLNRNDAAAIEAALTPEWKVVGADGAILDRAQIVEWFRSGRMKLDSYESGNYEVHLHGDAAVVIGVDHSKGKLDGEPFDMRERFSDFYVRKNGKWICVWTHSSTLAEEP